MSEQLDSMDDLCGEIHSDGNVLGLSWSLSEETKGDLREIDANIRAAEQLSGRLTVG